MVHTSGPPIIEYIIYITIGLVICALVFSLIVYCLHRRIQKQKCRDEDEDTIDAFLAKDRQKVMKKQMDERVKKGEVEV